MKSVKYSTLEGLELSILNYESYEEADLAAGKPGAMLDEGNKNLSYRGALATGRSALVEAIQKETGIAIKTKTEKGDDGKDVEVRAETDGQYLKRVRAEKGLTDKDAEWKAFAQPIADQVSQTGDEGKPLAVDIKEPDRKGGPKVLPKDYKTAAERVFTNGNQDKYAQMWNLTYVTPADGTPEAATAARNKNVEILGWAIRADVLKKEAEARAAYA